MKIVFGFVLGAALAAHATIVSAQTFPSTVVKGNGYTLQASAYLDPARLPDNKYNPASRFDLSIAAAPGSPLKWDFVLPDNPAYPYTTMSGGYGSPNYKTQTKTTIRATLRQFVTYDEKVTFKNLDLTPVVPSSTQGMDSIPMTSPNGEVKQVLFPSGPRFLKLSQARSVTTPSGITVTLPVQVGFDGAVEDMGAYNGNIDALWLHISVNPRTQFSKLPDSPLFRQHGRPVSIKIEVPEPNTLVYYAADNTYTALKVSFPNLQTLHHLDELTLIIRQRVDLQSIPVTIEVPISKPSPKAKPKTRTR